MCDNQKGLDFGYSDRPAFLNMSEAVDNALSDVRTVSLYLAKAKWTDLQRAIVGIVPIGMSVACSIRELVAKGYIPSAKMLVRPMIERVVISEFLFTGAEAVSLWTKGWPSKGRPKLAALLSNFEKGHQDDWKMYQEFMVDDFNSAIHPNPSGDDAFKSSNENGQSVFWIDNVPNAFELADNVCAATMMGAVFFASQAKRAFVWKDQ